MTPTTRLQTISWPIFMGLWAAFTAYAVFQGASFIFGPAVIETGDFAVNAIQIAHTKELSEIYGNYSRWGFNHPGPFFFYVYGLSEFLLFDSWHLVASPHQAHVLGGIVLQSGFLAAALAIASALAGKRHMALVWVAVAAAVLPAAHSAFSSIWPPHVLLAPYLLLIVLCAAISLGRTRLLPVAAFALCVLCHGHVAQPLLTMPLFVLALVLAVRRERILGTPIRTWLAANYVPVLCGLTIIAVFLIPLIVDLLRGKDSNVVRILDYLHHSSEARPKFSEALNYAFSYFVFDHTPEAISGIHHLPLLTKRVMLGVFSFLLTLWLPRFFRNQEHAAYRTLGYFIATAMLLAIVWSTRVTGPLYEFNSHFIYGIVLATWAMNATMLADLAAKLLGSRGIPVVTTIAAASTAIILVWAPRMTVFSEQHVLALKSPYGSAGVAPGSLAIIDQTTNEDWPGTTALALWLTRSSADYRVTHDWAYVFGWAHSLDRNGPPASATIWGPGRVRDMLASRKFDVTAFCRVPPSDKGSALPGKPQSINDARRQCKAAAVGLGTITNDPWAWTLSKQVYVQLPVPASGDSQLVIRAFPWLAGGKVAAQRVNITINGKDLGTQSLSTDGELIFRAPSTTWHTAYPALIRIDLPDARSPASDGLSPDPRLLGLGIRSVQVVGTNLTTPQRFEPPTSREIRRN